MRLVTKQSAGLLSEITMKSNVSIFLIFHFIMNLDRMRMSRSHYRRQEKLQSSFWLIFYELLWHASHSKSQLIHFQRDVYSFINSPPVKTSNFSRLRELVKIHLAQFSFYVCKKIGKLSRSTRKLLPTLDAMRCEFFPRKAIKFSSAKLAISKTH